MTISNEELARPTNHVFLSPHFDDIPLSCGGTVARLSDECEKPLVILLFGSPPRKRTKLTKFARDMHNKWGLSAAEVTASRMAEERQAAQILGYQIKSLPFSDAIYRGSNYLNDEELFGDVSFDEIDLPESVVKDLRIDTFDRRSTRFYAPLAIGNHVDHQIAFHAGLSLAREDWEVWFYEDMPYALDPARVELRLGTIRDLVEKRGSVDITATWDRKIDAIMTYASQLGVIFGEYVAVEVERNEIEQAMRTSTAETEDLTQEERYWKFAQATENGD